MSKGKRFRDSVCKPCWELKYSPYGMLVELFPLLLSEDQNEEELAELKALENEFEQESPDSIITSLNRYWKNIENKYDTSDLQCNVFGHICPVVMVAERFTETREQRRTGRYIPRDVMLKVVRRDGQICQICHMNVPDDKLEFDHVIPFAKGGPISIENLRVVCKKCNSKKRDSLREILDY